MADDPTPLPEDHHLLRDANDPGRLGLAQGDPTTAGGARGIPCRGPALGVVLILGGLALVPLPGPGWLVVLLGLAILGSEFEPAQRLLTFVREKLKGWNDWVCAQPWFIQGLFALLTAAFVLAILWLTLRISGVPAAARSSGGCDRRVGAPPARLTVGSIVRARRQLGLDETVRAVVWRSWDIATTAGLGHREATEQGPVEHAGQVGRVVASRAQVGDGT